jgi:hypothetical protein
MLAHMPHTTCFAKQIHYVESGTDPHDARTARRQLQIPISVAHLASAGT